MGNSVACMVSYSYMYYILHAGDRAPNVDGSDSSGLSTGAAVVITFK